MSVRMSMTIAGVPFRRSLVGWIGRPSEDHPPMQLQQYPRGLLRWRVTRAHDVRVLGRGQTATEAVREALAHPHYGRTCRGCRRQERTTALGSDFLPDTALCVDCATIAGPGRAP